MPHSWFLIADELHDQAMAIFEMKATSFLVGSTGARQVECLDRANRSAFLLGGFALENILKAYLVYENPSYIANGRLSRKLQGHSLTALAQTSKLAPWPKRSQPVLEAFQSGLTSWMRYPCATSAHGQTWSRYFTDELWSLYERLIIRYFREFSYLLAKPWKGPHHFEGSYELEGFYWQD